MDILIKACGPKEKRMTKEKKSEANGSSADGTALFPMPDTALGKACEAFVTVTQKIADAKVEKEAAEKTVLDEMHKEKRTELTVTVGNDNWHFEIKAEEEKLRCVKATRQPQPVTIEEQ
jgi:hypothetical protein